MKVSDIIENMDKRAKADTRGTRLASTATIKRRVRKVEERNAAVRSANEAGYRRGADAKERELNTLHDAEINRLRNQIASNDEVEAKTIAMMDRKIVIGFIELIASRRKEDGSKVWKLSGALVECVYRELLRGYAKEDRA